MRFDFDLNHEQFEALFTLMSRETKLKELFVSGNSGFISGGFTSRVSPEDCINRDLKNLEIFVGLVRMISLPMTSS